MSQQKTWAINQFVVYSAKYIINLSRTQISDIDVGKNNDLFLASMAEDR
jgi:hypothetical protein